MMDDKEFPMFELIEELKQYVNNHEMQTGSLSNNERTCLVGAETEKAAEQIADWDVDAADRVEVMQTKAVDTKYGVAFIIENPL
jgi:hypothetical protein